MTMKLQVKADCSRTFGHFPNDRKHICRTTPTKHHCKRCAAPQRMIVFYHSCWLQARGASPRFSFTPELGFRRFGIHCAAAPLQKSSSDTCIESEEFSVSRSPVRFPADRRAHVVLLWGGFVPDQRLAKRRDNDTVAAAVQLLNSCCFMLPYARRKMSKPKKARNKRKKTNSTASDFL